MFGGQASNGQLCGDLWALRGVVGGGGGEGDGRGGEGGGGGAGGGGGGSSVDSGRRVSATHSISGSGGGEEDTPRWTRLQLRGTAPSARAGHCVTAAGPYVVVFGGKGKVQGKGKEGERT